MERLFRYIGALDAEALLAAIARHDGSLSIGTAPDEWWTGYGAISAVYRVQFRAASWRRSNTALLRVVEEDTAAAALGRATIVPVLAVVNGCRRSRAVGQMRA